MRVVIDTNIVVSSFFGGNPKKILDTFKNPDNTWLITDEIVDEYQRVLADVFGDDDEVYELLSYIEGAGSYVQIIEQVDIIKDDPTDNKFLECAISGKANFIISGDKKHVLPLKKFREIPIVNAREFFEILEEG